MENAYAHGKICPDNRRFPRHRPRHRPKTGRRRLPPLSYLQAIYRTINDPLRRSHKTVRHFLYAFCCRYGKSRRSRTNLCADSFIECTGQQRRHLLYRAAARDVRRRLAKCDAHKSGRCLLYKPPGNSPDAAGTPRQDHQYLFRMGQCRRLHGSSLLCFQRRRQQFHPRTGQRAGPQRHSGQRHRMRCDRYGYEQLFLRRRYGDAAAGNTC